MSKKNSLELKIPPPVVFFFFAVFMWLLSIAAPWASLALPARIPITLAIAAAGGVLAGAGILSFLRAGTTVKPENPLNTTKLVTSGVYAVTRNPMYLSLLFVLIAWAVYLANAAAVLPIPFFAAYLTRFQIKPEERALARLFGNDYAIYSKRVRRWL